MMNKIFKNFLGSNVILDEYKLNVLYEKVIFISIITFVLLIVELLNVLVWNNKEFSIIILTSIFLFSITYLFITTFNSSVDETNKKIENIEKIKSSIKYSLITTVLGFGIFYLLVVGINNVDIIDVFIILSSFIVLTISSFYIQKKREG